MFVPKYWYDVVRQSKRKQPLFNGVPMASDLFHNSVPMEEEIINRKLDKDNYKVQWLKIQ